VGGNDKSETRRPRPPGFRLDAPIETERLRLRLFTPEDAVAVHEIRSQPEVALYLYGDPWDLAEAERAVRERAGASGLREDDDALSLAAERRADGRVVGEMTLWLRSAEHRQGEIGFVFHRDAQGRGYAREAATSILDLAFGVVGLHRVFGRTDARNEASAGLMRRLGMRQEAHLVHNEMFKGEWADELVFAILEDEWASVSRGSSGRAPGFAPGRRGSRARRSGRSSP
jgi:RimJ/RimL family protein N-acetyltransferase